MEGGKCQGKFFFRSDLSEWQRVRDLSESEWPARAGALIEAVSYLLRARTSCSVAARQTMKRPSLLPVTSVLPSGEKDREMTGAILRRKAASSWRFVTSHNLTMKSPQLLASLFPSGEKVMA